MPRVGAPPGAWDAHAHVIGPAPWVSPRDYDPPEASAQAYLELLDTLGLAYGVLVQASVHGTDNTALVAALEAHPERLRGVAAIHPDTPIERLRRLDALGVRGARVLTLARGGVLPEAAAALARRIAPLGWHIEFGVNGDDLPGLRALIDALPTPVVIAHFGSCGVTAGAAPENRAALLAMLEKPDRYVKLSGAYRLAPPPWGQMTPLAQDLARLAPHGLLWGSDWPHVALVEADAMPATEALFDAFCDWIPDADLRRAILVDNPARLYGLPNAD